MKTRPTLLVLLAVFVLSGCRTDAVSTPAASADIMGAEAIVESVTNLWPHYHPSRVKLGTWNVIAGANTEGSAGLAAGMRTVAEEGYRRSPQAPVILVIEGSGGYPSGSEWDGYVDIFVLSIKDETWCCPTWRVDFRRNGDRWEVQLNDEFVALGSGLPEDIASIIHTDEKPFIPGVAK